jgi:hypothetical protein
MVVQPAQELRGSHAAHGDGKSRSEHQLHERIASAPAEVSREHLRACLAEARNRICERPRACLVKVGILFAKKAGLAAGSGQAAVSTLRWLIVIGLTADADLILQL